MNDKRIRQIAVETVVNTDNDLTKLVQMVYFVGQDRNLPIFGKLNPVKRTITEIVELEKVYRIFISDNEVAQEWKDIPKSKRVSSIDYFIQ